MILIQTEGLETALSITKESKTFLLKTVSFSKIAASRNGIASKRHCFKKAVAITSQAQYEAGAMTERRSREF